MSTRYSKLRPTDEAWDQTCDNYREAGWTGEPDEWERMFWEAGFRQGVEAATRPHPTYQEELDQARRDLAALDRDPECPPARPPPTDSEAGR